MAKGLNKAQIIGNLGRDPEVRNFANGGSVVTFPVATTEVWKDRTSGERREKTEWHRVAIYSEPVGRVARSYLRKGDRVFIEGKMETRKWTDQAGVERYIMEIALRPYVGDLTLLSDRRQASTRDSRGEAERESSGNSSGRSDREPPEDLYAGSAGGFHPGHGGYRGGSMPGDMEDDVPF